MKKILFIAVALCVLSFFVGRLSVSTPVSVPEDSTFVISDATGGNTGTVEPIPERSVWVYNLTDNVVYEHRVQDSPHWSEIYLSDGTVIPNTGSYFVNTGKETLPATVTTEMVNEVKLIDGEHALQYYDWVFKTSNKTYKHRDSLMINISLKTPNSVPVGYHF